MIKRFLTVQQCESGVQNVLRHQALGSDERQAAHGQGAVYHSHSNLWNSSEKKYSTKKKKKH